jgi:hypothetical protein
VTLGRFSAKEVELSREDADPVLVAPVVPLFTANCGNHASKAFVNIVKLFWYAALELSVFPEPPERSEQCTCPA